MAGTRIKPALEDRIAALLDTDMRAAQDALRGSVCEPVSRGGHCLFREFAIRIWIHNENTGNARPNMS